MSIRKYLTTGPLELAPVVSQSAYARTSVAFTGVPRKHPYDKDRLLLITDPFSAHASFCEFRIADITHVEELSTLVDREGESVKTVRLWVRKKSWGLRYEPFRVEDTTSLIGEIYPPPKEG